ncbi:caspase family protein [Humitalea sp. 24SJ18S-53]|uniref:caspase family protein n=1 Tax=Humitalea sp. 24SJ18S-53 TaxID=3422307 RepID=UPI003D679280
MRRVLLVLLLAMIALPTNAQTARRVALVVGNGAYQAVPRLPNPGRDAQDVARVLRSLDFSVQILEHADRPTVEAALQRFSRAAAGAEIAAFFFAGHGIEARGENFLIPVEARLGSVNDLDFQAIAVTSVLRAMQGAQARLLFLDACRDNPFAVNMQGLSGSRSLARGLARVETADLGTLIAFATAPGTVAADGNERNSPFTTALVRHLAEPGLDIRQIMTRVRRSVVEATGGRQVPWDNSSLVSDVVLRAHQGGQQAPAPTTQPAVLPTLRPPGTAAGRDNWAVARRVAAERGIPLPRDIPPGNAERAGSLGHWVGAWGAAERWNRVGRHQMIIIPRVDEANGTAEVIYAQSGPTERSHDPTRPGTFRRFVGRVTAEALTFTGPWTFRMSWQGPNSVMVHGTPPPGEPGLTPIVVHVPRVE